MKLTRLLALVGTILLSCSAWAQTDVTSTYITNADFSSTSGWKNYSGGGSEHSEGAGLIGTLNLNSRPSTTDATHLSTEYCFGFSARWNGRYTYYQQVATGLQAGAYTLTYDVQDVNSSSTKYNMDNHFYVKVGDTKYADTSTEWMNAGASSWTTHTISFTLNETSDITISFGYGNKENKGSGDCPAIYVSHLKLEVYPFATTSDYEALSTAISTVEGITWGFDAGEYAPYNYVEVIQALATAKAIDQDANNSQATVQALTATLNTAMTANAAEVNAIFDGSFEHDYSGQSGNINPIGWQRVKDADADGYNVRLMNGSNAGLAATSSGKAIFTKQSAYYGYAEGYTMPLNANTYYTISFIYGGWGDCKSDGYISMADPEGNAVTLSSTDLPLAEIAADTKTSAWYPYSSFFKTGAAGDYAIGLRKKNYDTSGQSQYVYGDFVLKTTTVAEATAYYNTVKDEVDDSYDAGANGGSEKTDFKAALDASVPSTVAEIMEAAAALYTLRDAFVAATPKYNALETERASAIALGVTSESANAVTMTTADELQEKLQALYVLEDAAATSDYGVNATTLFGSWTTQNMDTKFGEHWSGDASRTYYDRWQNSGFTSSITSTMTLPAGKYVFKVAARAQEGGINGAFNMSVKIGDADAVQKDFVAKSATGYGIETSGVANYSAEGTYANTTGRGWEWRFIGFELNESASVTMTAYAQILANNWVGFSDATLLTTSDNVAVLKDLLNTEIATATDIDKTTNVGEGVFQTPSSAVTALNAAIDDAQDVYDDDDATSSDVSTAISDLQAAETTYNNTVNAPADGKKYYIKVATSGHAKENKAWLLAAGATSANNPTGYTMAANNAPADYLAQAFTFTQVSGNTYNISITLPEGEVYLTYGSLNGSAADWNKMQIQATTESANKGEFKIYAGNAANTFKIFNTEQNDYIDCQDGGNIYTDTGITKDLFAVAEASQASVSVNISAGKYGTRIFPFTPTLPSAIKAYSCEETAGSTLTLVEEDSPVANMPYIIYSEDGYSGDALTGWGSASADSYTEGYLTGVYASTAVPTGSYVLQTLNEKQAFYIVDNDEKDEEHTVKAPANRAYLTVSGSEVKAFFFDEATGIENLNVNDNLKNEAIYNVAGQRVSKAQKGLYIKNGKKVVIK